MAKTKGTDIIALRKLFREMGSGLEQKFLAQAPLEIRELYRSALASAWYEMELEMALYQEAAVVLFPEDPEPMASLGAALARQSYTGIYRIFLRIPKIEYVMKRAADIWETYYDTGQGTIENVAPGSLDFVVRGFPELPLPMRVMAKGHMVVLIGMTGGKEVRVTHDSSDADAWRWKIQWQQ